MRKVLRLFTDGACRGNPGPAGLGAVIEDDQGMRLRGICKYLGVATNNVAEYQALIMGLESVVDWKPDRLEVYMDSKLVVEQVTGKWKIKDANIRPLAARATSLLKLFPEVEVTHVPRERNHGADALANQGIDGYQQR